MNSSIRKYAALVLDLIVVIAACAGVLGVMIASIGSFMGGANSLKYFTIQSNIVVCIVSLIAIIRSFTKAGSSRVWSLIRLACAVSITLTGSVFCFVLAPTFGAGAWNLNNVLTHVVVPIAAVAAILIGLDLKGLKTLDALWSLIPPFLYVFFAAYGYITNMQFAPGINYPYFFLNWGSPAGAFGFTSELPFMGCVWWIVILCILLFFIACGYIALSNRKSRK